MAPVSQNLISFSCDTLADEHLLVTRLDGVDRVSRLYRYELELVSKLASLDLDALIGTSCALGIKQGVQLRGSESRGRRTVVINGVVTEMELCEKRHDQVVYRAVIEPRLWKLTQTFVSQVYLQADIKDLIAANLTAAGLVEGADFDLSRLAGDYPKREYVVQYEETDFDFLCRWLEHEGVFFFFEQTENGDLLVFGDDPSVYKDIAGHPQLAYRPPQSNRPEAEVREGSDASEDWFAEEVVQAARWRQRPVPTEVRLKDYNWRNPNDPLEVGTAVNESNGIGLWWEYNDHFKTDAEGKQLADVRAGEFLSRERQLFGGSDCRSLQAGATFELVDHFRAELNATWLLTEVRHHATQTVALATGASVSATYSNEFVAMPADRVFRPERITDWPSIKGVIHAVVESTVDGKPDINDDGAYRVRLPFDVAGSDKPTGGASRYIRFAQPHAGPGYGTHFPLRAGAEVILTHIDGDPDRPIIAGAVPNRTHMSPVTRGNQEKNVIRSASGNHIEMDDTPGYEGLTMYNGSGTNVMSFRTTGAGGGGGAGGVTPPASARDMLLPPLDASASAVAGGFTGTSFHPRVGLFSGPLGQLSPDGASLLPRLADHHPDHVVTAEADDSTTNVDEVGDAETSFANSNSLTVGTWHDYTDRVVAESPDGGGNFLRDESAGRTKPDTPFLKALDEATDANKDESTLRSEARADLRAALEAWDWLDDLLGGTQSDASDSALNTALTSLQSGSYSRLAYQANPPDGEKFYEPWPWVINPSLRPDWITNPPPGFPTFAFDTGPAETRSPLLEAIDGVADEAQARAEGSWGADISESYLDRSYTSRHSDEKDAGEDNQEAQEGLRLLREADAKWRLAGRLAGGETYADIWETDFGGAIEFTFTDDASSSMRSGAGKFVGSTSTYTWVTGSDIEVTEGHHGRYRTGTKTEVNTGTVKYEFNNYDTTSSQMVVRGDRVRETVIGGAVVEHLTVLGGIKDGTSTIYAPGYGNANASDADKAAISSAGPATIYGNIDAQNTVVYGTINGRNLTVYADPDGDGIAVNGMTQHIYGDIEGQNKYVYGYSNGETYIEKEDRGKTVVGSSHSESLCIGNSFSQSEIQGVSLSHSYVATAASASFLGNSWSFGVGGVHGSLSANILNLSVSAAANIAASFALNLALNVAGSLEFNFGHKLEFSGGGSTELNPTVKNKAKAAENRLVALECGVHNNKTMVCSLANQIGSSRRWKQNIIDLVDALDLVAQLRGVRYQWKADGSPDVGFIAEEVGQVLPEVVEFEDNGVDAKSICYAKLTAVLVEAVKEQQQQIDEQADELHAVRSELDALRAQVAALADALPAPVNG